jgi:hypothetical protein
MNGERTSQLPPQGLDDRLMLSGRPTMKDVAALARVGTKTVSRVVNREPHVSPTTVARVLAAIDLLGYTLDHQAADLRRRASRPPRSQGGVCPLCGEDQRSQSPVEP